MTEKQSEMKKGNGNKNPIENIDSQFTPQRTGREKDELKKKCQLTSKAASNTDMAKNKKEKCVNNKDMDYAHECWQEFDSFLKKFYRMVLDGKKLPDDLKNYISVVSELVKKNPSQLFARLEMDLKEFILELKLRQLELLHDLTKEEGPHLFIFCLIEGYNKLMYSAFSLSPLLQQLEAEHLSHYNITWRGFNQHLFHANVFADEKVQKVLPQCITLLGKDHLEICDLNKTLVKQFLSFDEEMTKVGGRYEETEEAILKYYENNAVPDGNCRMTKINWNFIKKKAKKFHEEVKSVGETLKKMKIDPDHNCGNSNKLVTKVKTDITFSKSCSHPPNVSCDSSCKGNADISIIKTSFRKVSTRDINGVRKTIKSHLTTSSSKNGEGATVTKINGNGASSTTKVTGPQSEKVHEQYLIHQQRRMDEMHALLSPKPKDVQIQVQHRLIQKNKKGEEKVQHIHQYTQQYPDKTCESSGCNAQKSAGGTGTPNKMQTKCSISVSSTQPSTGSQMAKRTGNNANSSNTASPKSNTDKSNSPTITHKTTTTQTTLNPASVDALLKAHLRPRQPTSSDNKTKATNFSCGSHSCGDENCRPNSTTSSNNDHCYSSGYTSDDDDDWDNASSPQRQCDCCYCEVFGNAPTTTARGQNRLERMRRKVKKAKNEVEEAKKQDIKVNEEKSTKTKNSEYKGDKSIDEILDFIEGNEKNTKKLAKKMRRKQRIEEEERLRKEEEERLRIEEEKRKLEEEKRQQELLKKQSRNKKGKKESKQQIKEQVANANKLTSSVSKNKTASGSTNNLVQSKNKKEKSNSSIKNQGTSNVAKNKESVKKNISGTPQSTANQHRNQKVNEPGDKGNSNFGGGDSSEKSQMVTIKREIDYNNVEEPKVTVTVRRANPKDNELLYTIQNGQMCQAKTGEKLRNKPVVNIKSGDINEGNNGSKVSMPTVVPALGPAFATGDYNMNHYNVFQRPPYGIFDKYDYFQSVNPTVSSPVNMNVPQHPQNTVTITRQDSMRQNTYETSTHNNLVDGMERMRIGSTSPMYAGNIASHSSRTHNATSSNAATELISPAAIQINQAVNQLSAQSDSTNDLKMQIELPPGITITKIDPSSVTHKPPQPQQMSQVTLTPAPMTMGCRMNRPPHGYGAVNSPTQTNMIYVDTQAQNSDDGSVNGKKKRRRRGKKNGEENGTMSPADMVDSMETNSFLENNVSGINSLQYGGMGMGMRMPLPMVPGSSGIYDISGLSQSRIDPPVTPAIIQKNGEMVTIRNPALNSFPGGQPTMYASSPNYPWTYAGPTQQPPSYHVPDHSRLDGATTFMSEGNNGLTENYDKELEEFTHFCLQRPENREKPKVTLDIEHIKKSTTVIGCS